MPIKFFILSALIVATTSQALAQEPMDRLRYSGPNALAPRTATTPAAPTLNPTAIAGELRRLAGRCDKLNDEWTSKNDIANRVRVASARTASGKPAPSSMPDNLKVDLSDYESGVIRDYTQLKVDIATARVRAASYLNASSGNKASDQKAFESADSAAGTQLNHIHQFLAMKRYLLQLAVEVEAKARPSAQ